MGMCCEKKMMTGWRNVWSMKLRVQDQEEDQRGPRERLYEDCQACKMNKEDAIDRCKWTKMIKDVRWSGWVWVGECFFWYRPTRVVKGPRLLNGCVCVCMCVCACVYNEQTEQSTFTIAFGFCLTSLVLHSYSHKARFLKVDPLTCGAGFCRLDALFIAQEIASNKVILYIILNS